MSTFFRIHIRPRALVLVLASAALLASACQGTSGVAASVNGHAITQADLDTELRAILNNAAFVALVQQGGQLTVRGTGVDGTFDLAFADKVLGRQIILELVHEEIVRRHIVITPAELKAGADQERQQEGQDAQGRDVYGQFSASYQQILARRNAEVVALENALGTTTINEAAIQQYYNDNLQRQFTQSCVSHILVPTQAQADQIRAQLVAGADFATLARQFSKDPGSAAKGGDLGCNPSGTFVAEFEQAVSSLSVGQISPVVHTQFGYHIIKVTDRKVIPLADARSRIVQALQSAGQNKISQFLQNAVAKAKVTVSRRYGTFVTSGAQAGSVVPPNAPPPSAGGVIPTTPTTTPSQGGPTSSAP